MCQLDRIMGWSGIWLQVVSGCLSGYFWMRLAFEWAEWAKWLDCLMWASFSLLRAWMNKNMEEERICSLWLFELIDKDLLLPFPHLVPRLSDLYWNLHHQLFAFQAFKLYHLLSWVSSLHIVDRTSQPP